MAQMCKSCVVLDVLVVSLVAMFTSPPCCLRSGEASSSGEPVASSSGEPHARAQVSISMDQAAVPQWVLDEGFEVLGMEQGDTEI